MLVALDGRTMIAENMARLTSVKASKVLYEYDHFVEFGPAQEFLIIYGPNGIGKTKFLEIIDAASKLQATRLLRIPFESVVLSYSNGSRLSVSRVEGEAKEEPLERVILKFVLETVGQVPVEWTTSTEDTNEFESFLHRHTDWIKIGSDLWQDRTDGELADTEDLEMRFGSRVLNRSRRGARQGPPDKMKEFAGTLQTHLIETQRLKIEEYLDRNSRIPGRGRRAQTTIVEYANQMQKLLSSALAENSRITQKLDRTFPNRMLTRNAEVTLSEEDLRKKYESQNKFRSRLAQIALIGLEPELSLPPRSLQEHELLMLDLYLKDADEKLHSFEALLGKIELLEKIINTRLLSKSLQINAHDGLMVKHRDSRPINLDALSSGEQHEIILMFDLLFNVRPGSLVMIDEPEISLHVSWQVKFIDDVRRIAELAGFQFIVATHSPQIINTWWSEAIQLGPQNGEF